MNINVSRSAPIGDKNVRESNIHYLGPQTLMIPLYCNWFYSVIFKDTVFCAHRSIWRNKEYTNGGPIPSPVTSSWLKCLGLVISAWRALGLISPKSSTSVFSSYYPNLDMHALLLLLHFTWIIHYLPNNHQSTNISWSCAPLTSTWLCDV